MLHDSNKLNKQFTQKDLENAMHLGYREAEKLYSKQAINYETMNLGCHVVNYRESIIIQYIFHLRFSMYGGMY